MPRHALVDPARCLDVGKGVALEGHRQRCREKDQLIQVGEVVVKRLACNVGPRHDVAHGDGGKQSALVVARADEAAADPAFQFELEDPSTYWGENVVAPHTTRESAYANVLPELADEPMSNLIDKVNDVLPLDEIEDAVLPDGTVVPAVYVKLRNHLNRIGQGIGSTPVETSYQMIQYLWSEEDAQHEIEMPINVQFDALEYHYLSGRPVEECKEILDDLAMRGMIMRAHRSGHDVYHLLPYINGFWEFNELRAYFENGGDSDGVADAPEAYAAAAEFDAQGIGGAEPGQSFEALVPLFHTYPVSADVVEEGELAQNMDWKAIIQSNEQITVSPCQCRLMWKSLGVPMCHGDGDHPFETCPSASWPPTSTRSASAVSSARTRPSPWLRSAWTPAWCPSPSR